MPYSVKAGTWMWRKDTPGRGSRECRRPRPRGHCDWRGSKGRVGKLEDER